MSAASAWRISAVALADAREHDLARIAAGGDDARELAAGDDVEAGPEPREHAQDREVRVRLQRIAHQVLASGEGRRECAERVLEGGARVDVAGGAEARRNRIERDRLDVQPPVAEREVRHRQRFCLAAAPSAASGGGR